ESHREQPRKKGQGGPVFLRAARSRGRAVSVSREIQRGPHAPIWEVERGAAAGARCVSTTALISRAGSQAATQTSIVTRAGAASDSQRTEVRLSCPLFGVPPVLLFGCPPIFGGSLGLRRDFVHLRACARLRGSA